jgi:Flp pilus assembly protein TadD
VLFRAGLLEESVAALEQAIAIDPDYAEAHGNLAIAYGKLGRFEDAAREMRAEQQLRASRPQQE